MALSSLFGSDFDLGDWNNSGVPVQSYNFVLVVEGIFDIPCKSVRAFKKENEFELIQEGGLNDYVHMRRKPISKPFQFQVERYLGTDKFDIMSLGTDFLLPLVLCVSRWQKPSEANSSRFYVFMGATVIEKEYSTLDSEKSGLHTETITIAYKELFAANQNFFNTNGDTITNSDGEEVEAGWKWAFNKKVENRAGIAAPEAKKGNERTHARMNPGKRTTMDDKGKSVVTFGYGKDYKEASQADMKARAKKWTFNKTSTVKSKAGLSSAEAKKGSGTASAVPSWGIKKGTGVNGVAPTYGYGIDFVEPTQATFEGKKHLWEFYKDPVVNSKAGLSSAEAKKGKGTASARPSWGVKTTTVNGKTTTTYGSGDGFKEPTQADLTAKKHLWKFKTDVENRAAISAPDAKKGDGVASAAKSWGSKTTMENGKVTITYGSGSGFDEPSRTTMQNIADTKHLWKFKKGVNSKAGSSSPEAKAGDGVASAPPSAGVKTGAKAGDPPTYGYGDGYKEALQSTYETEAAKHMWAFKENEVDGNGKRNLANDDKVPASKKLSREAMEDNAAKHIWKFNKDAASRAANSSSDAKEGSGDRHLPQAEPEENKELQSDWESRAKLWPDQESAEKRNGGTEPEVRLWPDKESAVKRSEGTEPEVRLWPDQESAVKRSGGTEPEARLWPDQSSAVRPKGGSDPEKRHWPDQSSAVHPKGGSDPEKRHWPDQSSAVRPSGGQNPEERLWPKQSSAVKQEKGKDSEVRLYPEVKSAVYYTKGQNPEPRLWPQKKSAVYITDILSQK